MESIQVWSQDDLKLLQDEQTVDHESEGETEYDDEVSENDQISYISVARSKAPSIISKTPTV